MFILICYIKHIPIISNFSQKVCEKGFFENKNVYHTKYMLTSVSRVSVKQTIMLNVLCLIFKIKNKLMPNYACKHLLFIEKYLILLFNLLTIIFFILLDCVH